MIKRRLLKILTRLVLLAAVFFVGGYGYIHMAKFGAFPEGARLQKIEASPNYRDGEFRNLEPIPTMTTSRTGIAGRLLASLTAEKDRPRPERAIPAVKTDLSALDINEDLVIWLGHSSFYMHISGRRILVDPVFSSSAAPIPFANRAFPGTSIYTPADMPDIDILLITHDHWDHLGNR